MDVKDGVEGRAEAEEEDRTQTASRRELVERAALLLLRLLRHLLLLHLAATFDSRRLWFRNTRLSRSPPHSLSVSVPATRTSVLRH